MEALNTFKDAVYLRQVHRYVEEKAEVPLERREEYKKDAKRFLEVTRGMADCKWNQDDYAWLRKRNRTLLQQTPGMRIQCSVFVRP